MPKGVWPTLCAHGIVPRNTPFLAHLQSLMMALPACCHHAAGDCVTLTVGRAAQNLLYFMYDVSLPTMRSDCTAASGVSSGTSALRLTLTCTVRAARGAGAWLLCWRFCTPAPPASLLALLAGCCPGGTGLTLGAAALACHLRVAPEATCAGPGAGAASGPSLATSAAVAAPAAGAGAACSPCPARLPRRRSGLRRISCQAPCWLAWMTERSGAKADVLGERDVWVLSGGDAPCGESWPPEEGPSAPTPPASLVPTSSVAPPPPLSSSFVAPLPLRRPNAPRMRSAGPCTTALAPAPDERPPPAFAPIPASPRVPPPLPLPLALAPSSSSRDMSTSALHCLSRSHVLSHSGPWGTAAAKPPAPSLPCAPPRPATRTRFLYWACGALNEDRSSPRLECCPAGPRSWCDCRCGWPDGPKADAGERAALEYRVILTPVRDTWVALMNSTFTTPPVPARENHFHRAAKTGERDPGRCIFPSASCHAGAACPPNAAA